ncbi:hypothetical protein P154DRAFT_522825 [Amniculicola lignicola CBS 123094]|uniref:Transcription factor domain-containing protein n=1 Tax=Amniculicola lignicola CBS 123094 TaxID=1392246 RepID=A0A6A5WGH6_9PLEO|nr:hypothetical protein P154DRAFT_522825 [Amniculicola lignicola CBS 123094]
MEANQDSGFSGGRRAGKQPKQQPKMKFMFIDSTNQGANAKPDKAVRSFVMFNARRQQKWSTKQKIDPHPETASTPCPKSKRNATRTPPSRAEDYSFGANTRWTDFDLVPSSSGSSDRSRSPSGSVCSIPFCFEESCEHQTQDAVARRDGFAHGVFDPFDCLPVRTDARTSWLIDHFRNVISPRLIPLDIRQSSTITTTEWVANSLRDSTSAPFTYALLTSSSLHLQALGAKQDTLHFKAKAIEEINKMLSHPQDCVDDNNIAAVFMLLCLEESQLVPGNAAQADWTEAQRTIHLNGLRSMIYQRGGLAALNSRCLQSFILMHSIAHSIASFQPPYTALLDSTGAPQQYDLPSFRARPSSNRILRQFKDLKLDADLLTIISNIVVYVGDLSVFFEERRTPVEPLEMQKHAALIVYRLFDWYSKVDEERLPIDQSVCLAVMAFMVRVSHPGPSYRNMIITVVKKLQEALGKGSVFRWAKSPNLLLWTLTMGALAAQESSESGFFAQYCSMAFPDAGVDERTTTEELLERMKKCLWVPAVFDEEVKKLWIQMGLAKGPYSDVDLDDGGMISPDIREDDVVGIMTSERFFKGSQT